MRPIRDCIKFVLVISLLLSSMPRLTRADNPSDSLLQQIRQIEETARDRSVKDDLRSARNLLQKAEDRRRQGDEDGATGDYTRAHDILRRLVDAPRGEGDETQEKVADVLRGLEETMAGPGAGPHLATVETGFGLHTASFDTLQGTVTVNLPDDMAAGDQISGTVVTEAKGKDEQERAANQDQLNGLVVELGGQPQTGGMNVAKWVVPAGLAAVPLLLKTRTGTEIGRASIPTPQEPFPGPPNTDNPVSNKGETASNKQPGKPADLKSEAGLLPYPYQVPVLAQAGRPLEVKGKFDGDLKTTAVSIANRAVKVLAESPRKAVAQSPAGVIGAASIEVKKRGVTVAHCVYRSLGIRLSAAKLNLIRGEQTTMTVAVLGLDDKGGQSGAAARVHLVNRSPWVVRMQGGESQTFAASANETKNGVYSTIRTLTGLKAGGFSINATVEPVNGNGQCQPPQPIDAINPSTARPGSGSQVPRNPNTSVVSPGTSIAQRQPGVRPDSGFDSEGEPTTSTGTHPVDPLHGTFRVSLSGYKCNHQTVDDALAGDGVGDEVTLINQIAVVDRTGRMDRLVWGDVFSSIMGQRPRNEIQAGSATDRGGIVTGDGFPTSTPWIRSAPFLPNIPPNVLFEGELTQRTNAAMIIPTIWEFDGPAELQARYADAIERDAGNIARTVQGMINATTPPGPRAFLSAGSALGVGNTVTLGHGPLGLGEVNNRPIGMQTLGSEYGFTPQALILTYDLALAAERIDLGFGRGVVPVRYVDDRSLEGDYTLFIKVERTDSPRTSSPECADLSATFTGTATMTTTNLNAPGPFHQGLRLSVDFTECRTIVRITDFPAITVGPFDTPLGSNRTTVTLASGGTGRFDATSGRLDVDVVLHFAHSLDSPLAGPSDLTLSLSTAGPGGRTVRLGHGILTGSGTFRGGFLGGSTGRVVIEGDLSPEP